MRSAFKSVSRRTPRALRFAASCAGPGLARLMLSLCFTSCSSSFLIFSSNLPDKFTILSRSKGGLHSDGWLNRRQTALTCRPWS